MLSGTNLIMFWMDVQYNIPFNQVYLDSLEWKEVLVPHSFHHINTCSSEYNVIYLWQLHNIILKIPFFQTDFHSNNCSPDPLQCKASNQPVVTSDTWHFTVFSVSHCLSNICLSLHLLCKVPVWMSSLNKPHLQLARLLCKIIILPVQNVMVNT